MNTERASKLMESALFMATQPVTVNELMKISELESYGVALKVAEDLMTNFNERNSGLEIIKLDGPKYKMKVKEEYSDNVSHLALDTEMSKATLRCLGLIAVKQPIKQSHVVGVIGNKAYNYIKELISNGFVKASKAGTTKMLATTQKFETYFGKQAGDINKMVGAEYQAKLE